MGSGVTVEEPVNLGNVSKEHVGKWPQRLANVEDLVELAGTRKERPSQEQLSQYATK